MIAIIFVSVTILILALHFLPILIFRYITGPLNNYYLERERIRVQLQKSKQDALDELHKLHVEEEHKRDMAWFQDYLKKNGRKLDLSNQNWLGMPLLGSALKMSCTLDCMRNSKFVTIKGLCHNCIKE
jgi:hypothetical protein